jgi:hypothetical protein
MPFTLPSTLRPSILRRAILRRAILRRAVVCAALLAAALSAAAPGRAGAATLTEADPGGFSGLWSHPTAVAAGVTRIEGTGAQNDHDFLWFSGLSAGAHSFVFTFFGPETPDWSYSAGGSLLVSDRAFRWGWDGTTAFTFSLSHAATQGSATLTLGEDFAGGELFLGLYFTHGSLGYAIDAPSLAVAMAGDAPAAVPLPPALLLLAGALATLGLARRRA